MERAPDMERSNVLRSEHSTAHESALQPFMRYMIEAELNREYSETILSSPKKPSQHLREMANFDQVWPILVNIFGKSLQNRSNLTKIGRFFQKCPISRKPIKFNQNLLIFLNFGVISTESTEFCENRQNCFKSDEIGQF